MDFSNMNIDSLNQKFDTEVPEWNFPSINDDTSFYINADGNLVISFNEGDVGPMSMGVVEFTIPHDVIADILK